MEKLKCTSTFSIIGIGIIQIVLAKHFKQGDDKSINAKRGKYRSINPKNLQPWSRNRCSLTRLGKSHDVEINPNLSVLYQSVHVWWHAAIMWSALFRKKLDYRFLTHNKQEVKMSASRKWRLCYKIGDLYLLFRNKIRIHLTIIVSLMCVLTRCSCHWYWV